MNKVFVLGGYGNFGQRIVTALVKSGIPTIIAGRNADKANTLASKLIRNHAHSSIETAIFDIYNEFSKQLAIFTPKVVINTCGPFQLCDYAIAEICIQRNIHYLDLADGRDFVTGISKLNSHAKSAGVLVVSGASTVPGLSSAVIEKFKHEFSSIDSVQYGISPGQKAKRGLATTQSIMTYVGKPLKPFAGSRRAYGWQGIYRQKYPVLGTRWMANCEIPDLDLFPEHYGIKSIRFSAGMELSFMHLGIWAMSWLVRLGLPLNLPKKAVLLLAISNWFDFLGTADGGMHLIIKGTDNEARVKEIRWFIIAKDGDGPQIPTIPAIILAKKLATGSLTETGAKPCIGMVTLEEYLAELNEFNIQDFTFKN